jgi:hypothetical protein
VLSSKVDSKTEEIYLWLAKQVNALLAAAASQQHVSIAPGLESALRQDGFTTSGGRIRNRLIVQTMIERFGTDLLKELGLAMWINTRHSRASPVASIQRCKKEHTQVPNILHVLLTANLIVDDVLKLKNNSYTHATHVHPHLGKRPDGRMARQRTTKDSIESALSTTNGILNSAAKLLNLSPQNLLTDIRYHHVLLRLSKTQIDRIGGGQIEAARTALRDGMSMQELCQSLGISKWSVTLIQADDPSLYKLHQEGKVTKKRRNNREIILAFMASRPFAGRTELRRTHYYTVEFARKHENEWLEKNLPTSVPRSGKRAGKIRINWEERDSKVQIAVLEEVNAELKKTGRPIRLTITRLKSAAGLLSSNYNRVPSPQYQQIILDINKLVESRVAFRLRLIKWAMQEYSKLHIPISSNKLRRIARLPIAQLLECRPVVIACAEELQLEFHSSCSLSPLATRYPTQK